jgi:hypothetical protein
MELKFLAWETKWSKASGWTDAILSLPVESGLVIARGSGAAPFDGWNNELKKSEIGGTSRAVFQALSLALQEGSDPQSGGAPQVVGLRQTRTRIGFWNFFQGKNLA